MTHYKTKSVHFWGLMNSATKTCKAYQKKPLSLVLSLCCKLRWSIPYPKTLVQ